MTTQCPKTLRAATVPLRQNRTYEQSFRYIRTRHVESQLRALRERGNPRGVPLAGHGLYR